MTKCQQYFPTDPSRCVEYTRTEPLSWMVLHSYFFGHNSADLLAAASTAFIRAFLWTECLLFICCTDCWSHIPQNHNSGHVLHYCGDAYMWFSWAGFIFFQHGLWPCKKVKLSL
jgi:hypothetical protein